MAIKTVSEASDVLKACSEILDSIAEREGHVPGLRAVIAAIDSVNEWLPDDEPDTMPEGWDK